MKPELKNNLSYKKTMAYLVLLTVAAAVVSLFIGDITLPIVSALLAALFTLENRERRILSYLMVCFLAILNTVSLILLGSYSFLGLFSILFALVMHLFYTREGAKTDCVFAMTVLGALFTAASFIYFAMKFADNYSFSAVPQLMSSLRIAFDKLMNESVTAMNPSLSEEQISSILSWSSAMFDSFKLLSLSFAVIVGFVISGITLKLYSFAVLKLAKDGHYVLNWRFATSNVFAIFYIVLSFVSVFALSSDSFVTVAIANLYNIFMVVYAYFGFNFAASLISMRRSRGFAFLVLIFIILAFSSFAIEILSFMGVFYTITENKRRING